MQEVIKSMREVFKVNARVFKVNGRSFKVSVGIDRQAHRSKSVSRQSGDWESLAYLSQFYILYFIFRNFIYFIFRISMAYLIVGNGDLVGNGSINFVTPLSPLFRIIDISHIPHCYGKNTNRSITPLS